VRLHFLLAALFFFFAQPLPMRLAAGAMLVVVGLGVRAWAAGHLRREGSVTLSGPYAYLRHPLYLGTAVILAGFALAGGRLWLAVVLGGYFGFLFVPVIRQEERARRSLSREEYGAYAARVPAFLPRLRPADLDPASGRAAPARFDFQLYRRNQEWRGALGCGLLLLLLWGKMLWG
jgi:protein-S-isoprenylcysteine O-methyltransferase Ste14